MAPPIRRATQLAFLVVLLLLTSGGVPGGALLGQAAGAPASGQVRPTDERLEIFVDAFVRVGEIRDRLHRQFARAHAPKARQEIRTEADQQIAAVLAELGMSPLEFSETNRAIGVDAELRARFEAVLQSRAPD
jgi:hypothetical protein